MKLYLDTNVYLDYFLERRKSLYAEKIFFTAINCKHHIILSNHILSELTKNIPFEKMRLLLEMLRPKLILISFDNTDVQNAKQLSTHYADALHCVLAKKSNADIIITSNIKDYTGLFKTELPENI